MKSSEVKSVFISGKFKVIHSGHIRLFMYAKTLGENLVVALDSEGLDTAEIAWRIEFLRNQEFVDSVVVFEGDISGEILKLKPDIVLKGSEFESQFNAEASLVATYGGQLIFSSGSTYFSETDLLNRKEGNLEIWKPELPEEFLKRNKIERSELQHQLEGFSNLRVCVIGDLIVDEYINCHPLGMSREEPTVVVTPIDSMKFLGGAGIVAAHAVGLGANTTLITILGNDDVATWSQNKAREYGVAVLPIIDKNRPTTLKQRYRSGNHTLLKVSHLSQEEVNQETKAQIEKTFENIAANIDVLILSDFSYGTFSDSSAEKLIEIAKKNGIFVSADSQTSSQVGNLAQFIGADLVTPTEVEARAELKDNSSGLAVIVEKLRNRLKAKYVLLKLGSDGVLIHGIDQSGSLKPTDALPSLNSNPLDTSGAGDSMLAAASMALRVNADLSRAALLGSASAAIQISRTGNIPISQGNLQKILSP